MVRVVAADTPRPVRACPNHTRGPGRHGAHLLRAPARPFVHVPDASTRPASLRGVHRRVSQAGAQRPAQARHVPVLLRGGARGSRGGSRGSRSENRHRPRDGVHSRVAGCAGGAAHVRGVLPP